MLLIQAKGIFNSGTISYCKSFCFTLYLLSNAIFFSFSIDKQNVIGKIRKLQYKRIFKRESKPIQNDV